MHVGNLYEVFHRLLCVGALMALTLATIARAEGITERPPTEEERRKALAGLLCGNCVEMTLPGFLFSSAPSGDPHTGNGMLRPEGLVKVTRENVNGMPSTTKQGVPVRVGVLILPDDAQLRTEHVCLGDRIATDRQTWVPHRVEGNPSRYRVAQTRLTAVCDGRLITYRTFFGAVVADVFSAQLKQVESRTSSEAITKLLEGGVLSAIVKKERDGIVADITQRVLRNLSDARRKSDDAANQPSPSDKSEPPACQGTKRCKNADGSDMPYTDCCVCVSGALMGQKGVCGERGDWRSSVSAPKKN
jgi:hypothetical protein